MTDPSLKSLVKRASHAAAGPVPGIGKIQSRKRQRVSLMVPSFIATAATCAVAAVFVATMMTKQVQLPPPSEEPDMFALPDRVERSDWLVNSTARSRMSPSRSDWLMAGSFPDHQSFATDLLKPERAIGSETYILVDRSGYPLTSPDNPELIYVIERTTP